MLDLPPYALEVEAAQRLSTEPADLEVLVAGDVGVLLQLVRDPVEDGGVYAIGVQALEQQQRLEVRVGGHSSIHPPVALGGRGRW